MTARSPEISELQVRWILAALRDDLTEDERHFVTLSDDPSLAAAGWPDPGGPLYEAEDLLRAYRLDGTTEARRTFARWQQSMAEHQLAYESIAVPPPDGPALPETVDGAGLETIARDLEAVLNLAPDDAARVFIGLDGLYQALRRAQAGLPGTQTTFTAGGHAWAAQIGLRGIFEEFFKEHDHLCLATGIGRAPGPPPIIDTQPIWYTALPLPPRTVRWASPSEAAGWHLTLGRAPNQPDITVRAAEGAPFVFLPGSLQRKPALQVDYYWALHPGPPEEAAALVRGIFRILLPDEAIRAVERFSGVETPPSFASELEGLHRMVDWQLFETARRRVRRLLETDLDRRQKYYLHRFLAGLYRGVHDGLAARLPEDAPEIQWAADRARLHAQAPM